MNPTFLHSLSLTVDDVHWHWLVPRLQKIHFLFYTFKGSLSEICLPSSKKGDIVSPTLKKPDLGPSAKATAWFSTFHYLHDSQKTCSLSRTFWLFLLWTIWLLSPTFYGNSFAIFFLLSAVDIALFWLSSMFLLSFIWSLMTFYYKTLRFLLVLVDLLFSGFGLTSQHIYLWWY